MYYDRTYISDTVRSAQFKHLPWAWVVRLGAEFVDVEIKFVGSGEDEMVYSIKGQDWARNERLFMTQVSRDVLDWWRRERSRKKLHAEQPTLMMDRGVLVFEDGWSPS